MNRYEYRSFGLNFNLNLKEFKFIDRVESREIYILNLNRSDLNIKIRNNQLDIKILKDIRDKYQMWEVVYKEEYESKSEAMRREKELKSHRGRDFIRTMIV